MQYKNSQKLPLLLKTFSLAGLLLLTAGCDSDEKNMEMQPHDESKMMSIMDEMMKNMEAMPMNADPDINFAKMMLLHHQGAVEMANEELRSGDDNAMKATAQKVIEAQQKEIQDLQSFLGSYQPDQPMDEAFNMEIMDSMEKSGQASDLSILTGDTDHDFARLMVVHHQTAIENARAIQEHGTSPVIKEMAHTIVNAQMEEIKQLQAWLLANTQQ